MTYYLVTIHNLVDGKNFENDVRYFKESNSAAIKTILKIIDTLDISVSDRNAMEQDLNHFNHCTFQGKNYSIEEGWCNMAELFIYKHRNY